ncbi:L10-interacting MYB domain-containing protein-like isoform X2 [Abrus precatorius]|uniref:L10-interacting MYB domain-containing protein-like isoform X2 n=1 Tax=Abrus precatorius TaxID=3816 RepID=A0A8B8M8B2_ABRPR|nr:L10-interacting MYB domain-containing protein-like isoform X2 [Abrus precatorius]XP_027364018.1 L10-interacting MYB domain-containing protein-like isoform X2 [Abrus precatorius]XP_027364019.1 L10-interacting MYB domain-containing protein-like isoform X2 [Abrus precatorius]XP_027364020.1 L10-interacting MYB domain-containing protein-like isoform X2 [Abrus precatorius]
MGDDLSVSLDTLRANWTPSQDQYFLELLRSYVHKRNKTGKVFSRKAWADMIEQFNTKFGFKYDLDVLKNRHKRFRKQYNDIKMIVSQKGFQWDELLNMIIADDKKWDECIKVYPDAQAFKTRGVPYYNDLCIIFGHAVADGRYSLSCFDVDFENEEIASKELDDPCTTSKGVDDQNPLAVSNQSKIDWSPMMDHFFVELLLDQLCKGNKTGRSFKKKAWLDMTESFNDRFGRNYSKVVLKNRFNVLRRHYCSINVLLGKEGFSWDKTQHKVLADDQVWQKCIRVHHNFRLYRIKSMPFYSGMCIICRNEATVGCNSNLEKGSSGGNNTVPDTQLLPKADKGAFHIGGENNFARETQPLANADNEASLHVGKNVSGSRKRHQPKMPTTFNESKKTINHNEGMAVALKHMAVAVTTLNKKAKKEDTFSVDYVISELQAIPDMDDDLILDACDFLEDERRARIFLALDASLRKKWLLRKLRS